MEKRGRTSHLITTKIISYNNAYIPENIVNKNKCLNCIFKKILWNTIYKSKTPIVLYTKINIIYTLGSWIK